MKKLFAIGIIFLFIGVAVAPSINSTEYQIVYASDNRPPNDPTITGPRKGKAGVAYVFNFWTTDPENQNVSYFIDWGDNTSNGWSYYYKSGQSVHYSHTFDKWDFYAIRCKAKDPLGAESNWSYMNVPMFEDASDDLVEVTSQACGIQGFGNTTVKLTKQQYQDLEQYLVDFRAKLNQTTTREEAVPIFKDAVVELNKYGLLPKGMSVRVVQRLIVNRFQFLQQFVEPDDNKNHVTSDVKENRNCLITGKTEDTYYETGMQIVFIKIMEKLLPIMERLIPNFYSSDLFILLGLFIEMFAIVSVLLAWINPIALAYRMYLGTVTWDTEIHYIMGYNPASGWIDTRGTNGTVTYNGTMYGYLPYRKSVGWSFGFYTTDAFEGVEGFTGIRLLLPRFYSFYIGSALRVAIGTEPPEL